MAESCPSSLLLKLHENACAVINPFTADPVIALHIAILV